MAGHAEADKHDLDAKPRLNREQLGELRILLLPKAQAHSCKIGLWTAARVAALIDRYFAVHYHP